MTQGLNAVRKVDFSTDAALVNDAHALLQRAHEADGVEAFSEAFVTGIDRPKGHTHWALLIDGTLTALAACAPDGSVELVVDPPARRNGYGLMLAHTVLEALNDAGLWAHGDLPAAQALAAKLSLQPTRELLVMGVDGEELQAIGALGSVTNALPSDYLELSYPASIERWGRDAVEEAWLAVNNDAFSWHPEQGGWDMDALHEAMNTEWFEPEGVRFLWALGNGEPQLAGFHWTKRHSPEVGEVYVVGLSSDFRGQGLGDPLMRAGLEHLVAGGAKRVILYVEADNEPAVNRYKVMGFTVAERHKVYST